MLDKSHLLDKVVDKDIRTYVHGTTTVVLNHLVARVVCATADNPGFLASFVSFLLNWSEIYFRPSLREDVKKGSYNRDSILTHILKPYRELDLTVIHLERDPRGIMSFVLSLDV